MVLAARANPEVIGYLAGDVVGGIPETLWAVSKGLFDHLRGAPGPAEFASPWLSLIIYPVIRAAATSLGGAIVLAHAPVMIARD